MRANTRSSAAYGIITMLFPVPAERWTHAHHVQLLWVSGEFENSRAMPETRMTGQQVKQMQRLNRICSLVPTECGKGLYTDFKETVGKELRVWWGRPLDPVSC